MRPILWYLAFVGLPVVALLFILQLGEQLVPPRAVHGRYTVATDTSGIGPCLNAVLEDRAMTIAQSGPRLDVRLGTLTLEGELTAGSIRAAAALRQESASVADCLTSDTLRLAASLDTSSGPALVGELLFVGCATCPALPFRATRVSQPGRGV